MICFVKLEGDRIAKNIGGHGEFLEKTQESRQEHLRKEKKLAKIRRKEH